MPVFSTVNNALYNARITTGNVTMGVLPSLAAAIQLTTGAAYVMGNPGTLVADNNAPTKTDYWIAGLLVGGAPNIAAAGYYEVQFGTGSAAPAYLTYLTALSVQAAPTNVGWPVILPHYFPVPIRVAGGATSGLVARAADSVGTKTIDVKAIYLAGLGS